jgi:hypothetical protein
MSNLRSKLAHSLIVVAVAACSSSAAPPESPEPATDPAPTIAANPDATPDETLTALEGDLRYAGDAQERKGVDAGIEEVVSEMSFIAAGVARRKLKAANGIPEHVTISRDGEEVTIALDDRTYTAPFDGAPVEVTGITGDTLKMRLVVKEGKLEQRFVGDDGGRVNTFTPGDGGKMQLSVRVFSERLPGDVRYALTYRKTN